MPFYFRVFHLFQQAQVRTYKETIEGPFLSEEAKYIGDGIARCRDVCGRETPADHTNVLAVGYLPGHYLRLRAAELEKLWEKEVE